jgi:hypothetical protein
LSAAFAPVYEQAHTSFIDGAAQKHWQAKSPRHPRVILREHAKTTSIVAKKPHCGSNPTALTSSPEGDSKREAVVRQLTSGGASSLGIYYAASGLIR